MSANVFHGPARVMNKKPAHTFALATGRFAVGFLALFMLLAALPCTAAEERWLLIFDTSSAMKKRLPAMDEELRKLLATNMGGNLHSGDSVGVWTFDSKVHAGQFPLMAWQPENAMATETNLMQFLRKQDYKGQTTFDALQPLIDQVIRHSERLTVMIFCDGDGQMGWTPYDDEINQDLE